VPWHPPPAQYPGPIDGGKPLPDIYLRVPHDPKIFLWEILGKRPNSLNCAYLTGTYLTKWHECVIFGMGNSMKDATLKKHGLSRQEYDEMLDKQGGLCLRCRRLMQRPNIDHDHFTGEIRGILCGNCNMAWDSCANFSKPAWCGKGGWRRT